MKILNLYAGIGGNRKLWGNDYEITAVEINPEIAAEYQRRFPNDIVIIGDAHEYLLKNYMNFDIIWSSPPCPSHSDIRRCGVHKGQYAAIYPDMSLYQEIILLNNFFKGKFIIENVRPYYKPLIEPDYKADRHFFWLNFFVSSFYKQETRTHDKVIGSDTVYGFNIKDTKIDNKQKVLRNLVDPKLGKHLLECAEKDYNDQINIFEN